MHAVQEKEREARVRAEEKRKQAAEEATMSREERHMLRVQRQQAEYELQQAAEEQQQLSGLGRGRRGYQERGRKREHPVGWSPIEPTSPVATSLRTHRPKPRENVDVLTACAKGNPPAVFRHILRSPPPSKVPRMSSDSGDALAGGGLMSDMDYRGAQQQQQQQWPMQAKQMSRGTMGPMSGGMPHHGGMGYDGMMSSMQQQEALMQVRMVGMLTYSAYCGWLGCSTYSAYCGSCCCAVCFCIPECAPPCKYCCRYN